MQRLHFTLFLPFLFSLSCIESHQNKNSDTIENIVFIIGDDHSSRVLGSYGNSIIRTPNLDRLANEGVRFTRAFANAPMCSASRQSFLTGRYPHATGVTLLRTSFPEEQVTVAEHLKQFGYKTAAIGKMHFNNNRKHGFDTLIDRGTYSRYLEKLQLPQVPDSIKTRPPWKPFQDHARIWLNADARPGAFYDETDIGTYYAKAASDFLVKNQNDRFCLWVGFHEPHSPFNFPVEYVGRYDPDQMPLPAGSPEDDRWIPEVFKDLTEKERRGIISAYYTSVEYLDKNVGIILNKLESLGLSENTLVIYIGDHGYLLSDHNRFEKHMMWEPATNAPLLIKAGDQFKRGRVINSLTEFVDLVPTILDAINVDPMPSVQGESLMPVLEEINEDHKDFVFSEFLADNKVMIRTEEWKYIFSTGQRDLQQGYATGNPPPGIIHRLYNLKKDPAETTNVANKSENEEILYEMQDQLLDWFRKTHPYASSISESMTIEEQLKAFCEPPEGNETLKAM